MTTNETIIKELMDDTKKTLLYAIDKAGIKGDVDKIKSLITFKIGEERPVSLFLGHYEIPTEENPKGMIELYLDSIFDLSDFLGTDYASLVVKVMLCQIHNMFTYESKRSFDFPKAEQFASKACEKLLKQKIIKENRVKIYLASPDRVELTARQNWIQKWTGMNINQCLEKLETILRK